MVGKKVLIIDDDEGLVQLVSVIFKKAGAQVVTAHDGLDGISKFFLHFPDLIILDVMMPGNTGFDVCQRIRQMSSAPVIMLTALNKEQEMLRGLAAGADDFLSKPFHPEILLARARTVLRRIQRANDNNGGAASFSYNDGYLSIDIERHEVMIHGKRVKLTPVEFRLLVYLARNGGKLLTFERILTNVWGNEYRGSMEHVHVYISHLRRKIEQDTKNPRYIMTVHGMGYIFEKQELRYKI
ncbi:MAG TPA: response regulator transcription factor [Anaerolineales bacterium]|nr:response regulator transcription factor [Anaerolineales bacterium]